LTVGNEMARFIVELTLAVMLVVLASDLLYLYYHRGGCWSDPVKAMEVAEVILLWMIAGGGVSYIVWRIRREARSGR